MVRIDGHKFSKYTKGFKRPFLYNRREEEPCRNEANLEDYSGWDFVNSDNNIYDDNGHGTVVTYLMYKKMMAQNVDFQILPIKAFNQQGEGNYFDIPMFYISLIYQDL